MNSKKNIINNIKSKHILNYIFKYIEDKNFQDKLFLYSKKLQKKFDIKLIGLKENYLKKLEFDKYLYIDSTLFEKDFLKTEYNRFLKEKKVKDNEKLINIESPLFEVLSKTRNFGKIFTIYISQKIIDKHKLKHEYKKFFDKLNKLNIEYESIFYDYKDNNNNYLKDIKINFNRIKRLTIEIDYTDKSKTIKKKLRIFLKFYFQLIILKII